MTKGSSQKDKLIEQIIELVYKLEKEYTIIHGGCGDPSECCFNGFHILDTLYPVSLVEELNKLKDSKS